MGHFLSDLDKSREAVELLESMFKAQGYEVRELPKDEQKNGDLELKRGDEVRNVEIKFDIMAKRTGNLCFEMSNGKRMTGVMETKADEIYYVIPAKGCKNIFVFNPQKLRDYIENAGSEKVKIKNGGDKKKFILAIVNINHIVTDNVADEHYVLEG